MIFGDFYAILKIKQLEMKSKESFIVFGLFKSKKRRNDFASDNLEGDLPFKNLEHRDDFSLDSLEGNFSFKNLDNEFLDSFVHIETKEGTYPRAERGKEFERFLSKLFERAGYYVEPTYKKYAQATDLFVTDASGKRYLIEAKKLHIETTSVVTEDVVNKVSQAVANERLAGKSVHRGVIITTRYFAPDALIAAREKGIILINREKLFYMVAKLCPELLAKVYFEKTTYNPEYGRCSCKAPLIHAYNSKQKRYYYDCSSETCTITKSITRDK